MKYLKIEIIQIQKNDYIVSEKIRDIQEMLEDGLDEKQVKSMKYVVCIMCGFTCFNDITLKKQTNMKHGDILKDKKN